MSYKPLSAHLLRSNVGGHYSLLVHLPGGHTIQASIFPGLDPKILEQFNLEESPEGAPAFETGKVISLVPKSN